ncbi:MAG: IS30 family transposase [Candidatus Paceibacteria bacterium]
MWQLSFSFSSYTITFDRGTENAKHMKLRSKYGIDTYFCDAYCSWQKGSVENVIGLIRQYLPNKTDMSKVSREEIKQIQERLNNRPRKCLNYLTPKEYVNQELNT